MDNQHRLVKGYRDLSQSEVDAINSIKLAEQDIGQLWQQIWDLKGVDHRCLNIAKTELQQAFSWFVRAVAQPIDVFNLELPKESFLDRLKRERDETSDRLSKLKGFFGSEMFNTLDHEAQSDLRLQADVMEQYAFILSKRYDDAVAKQG